MYALGERGTLDSWLTTGRNTWRSVVERLEAMKWCLPEQGVGLFDFTGLEKFYGEKGVFILYKGINHVKLTLEGDAVQAKAYTGSAFLQPQQQSIGTSARRSSIVCGVAGAQPAGAACLLLAQEDNVHTIPDP